MVSGRAAAHIHGPDVQTRLPGHAAPGLDLRRQSVHVRVHQGKALFHRLADKGTVGAAGGAEGNADIDGDVPGAQTFRGLKGRRPRLQGQGGPAGGDIINFLQQLPGRAGRPARRQGFRHQLVGPDPGEHPPGGLSAGEHLIGPEKSRADGVAPLALPLVGRAALQGHFHAGGNGLSLPAQLHTGVAPLFVLPPGDNGPALLPDRPDRLIDRKLAGEEI